MFFDLYGGHFLFYFINSDFGNSCSNMFSLRQVEGVFLVENNFLEDDLKAVPP